MWIVRLALRRPYTFIVLSLMLFILAPVVISRTPTDIFPNINIPVVSVIWQYAGLSAEDISDRIVYVSERSLTTSVNNIEHIESQSMNGMRSSKSSSSRSPASTLASLKLPAVCKRPSARCHRYNSAAYSRFNASTVPILQLAFSGAGLTEQALFDMARTSCARTDYSSWHRDPICVMAVSSAR